MRHICSMISYENTLPRKLVILVEVIYSCILLNKMNTFSLYCTLSIKIVSWADSISVWKNHEIFGNIFTILVLKVSCMIISSKRTNSDSEYLHIQFCTCSDVDVNDIIYV